MIQNSPINAWRQFPSRYRLQGARCSVCKKVFYPKVYVCSCGSRLFVAFQLKGVGILLLFTRIHVTSTCFEMVPPYVIGTVKLSDGPRVVAQITDVNYEDLHCGMDVQAVLRKYYASGDRGLIHYGVKFVPRVR